MVAARLAMPVSSSVAIDMLQCPIGGGRMKPIAEITDKRVAGKMLEHIGLSSDAPEQQWPARGPPEWSGWVGWLDDEQRAPDDDANSATATDVK